ncbi:MAG: hydroxymethylbilane synthase [Acidimicrobiales bacterium]
MSATPLRIATRASALARWQAGHVAGLLGRPTELVLVQTTADVRLDVPIWEMGGKGVFVTEVQAAVLDGRADLAVHSGKDLPSTPTEGLTIAAVPERGDPRDALVGGRLADLRPGALVATGSVRRRAQLADLRPDLTFAGLRGNMATRLAKAGDFDAIVVAAAALDRLGLSDHIAEMLAIDVMLPQVAQGALVVECRADDMATLAAVAGIQHGPTRRAVDAERGFLATLGGDCDLPAGAHATVATDGAIRLDALLATPDGRIVLRHREHTAPDAAAPLAGERAARFLLAAGGRALLE